MIYKNTTNRHNKQITADSSEHQKAHLHFNKVSLLAGL